MSDEIYINIGTTFQQPYQGQVIVNSQQPNIRNITGTYPANAQAPFTYQHRSPFTYQNNVSQQEPNIRDRQSPFTYVRQGRTPFTYRHPFTYARQGQTPYSYGSPTIYQATGQTPFTYARQGQTPYAYQASIQQPTIRPGIRQQPYAYQASKQEPNPRNAQQPVPYPANKQSPYTYPASAQQPYPYIASGQEPNIRSKQTITQNPVITQVIGNIPVASAQSQNPNLIQIPNYGAYNFRQPTPYSYQQPGRVPGGIQANVTQHPSIAQVITRTPLTGQGGPYVGPFNYRQPYPEPAPLRTPIISNIGNVRQPSTYDHRSCLLYTSDAADE